VTELYEPLAEEKGFQMTVAVSPGLTMTGNRELIGQAIANLIDNALKYGAAGPGSNASDEVAVAARREGGDIMIEVADHGPGVGEADRHRVFDRFVRLEGARSRPGSGLGLSLVAAVAHFHNAQLLLEDNNPGLKAILRFPRAALRVALAPVKNAAE
jgi:signal transduction histidine kinase